jgi:hypothetical protein
MSRRSLATAALLGPLLCMPGPALSQQRRMKDMMNMPKMDSEKMPPVSALKPAEGASVEILSPKEGEVFKGDEIPVRFRMMKGRQGSHIHVYVDGNLMGMFETERGTLTGIPPGRHRLDARVVTKDHQTELKATDSVDFAVR